MNRSYSFVSRWQLKAPLKAVWDCIYESEQWPQWWKGVEEVKEIVKGDERGIGSLRTYTLSSPARYKLTFNLELEERIEFQLLRGRASGDLEGAGAWHLHEENGVTSVTCHWEVSTTVPWMNYLGVVLAPFFRYNHAAVMRWGAKSLARKLNAPLLAY